MSILIPATIFLHRIDTDLIDTGYMFKLDELDWRKSSTGSTSLLVGPKQNLLNVARTTLTEATIADK